VMVDTFGTGIVSDETISRALCDIVDLKPSSIINKFNLRSPIYKKLASYGHMGREDLGVKWEDTDIAGILASKV